jgi:thymidylate synthase (FAD)
VNIIREPKVYLVGRQIIDASAVDKFLADHEVSSWTTDTEVAGEKLVEIAGRLCYMSYGKPRPGGNKSYIDNIIKSLHGSVTEHVVWNFIFTGISRTCTHELVRHRMGVAYSQLSQRYVDESVAEYVEPDIIANINQLHGIWLNAVEQCHRAYLDLCNGLTDLIRGRDYRAYLDSANRVPPLSMAEWLAGLDQEKKTGMRKEARQAARSVLPNATETKIFVTLNARAARHVMEMRCSRFAEPEIRKLFNKVYDLLMVEAPNLFSDYQVVILPDGTFELHTPNRKV